MQKKSRIMFFLLLGVLASGCASDPSLLGTMWRPNRIPPYVYFEITPDQRIVGQLERDRFFAPLVLDEETHQLEIGSFAVSRSKGSDPDLEKSFFAMLGSARSYRLEEHYLLLYDQSGELVGRMYSPFPFGRYPPPEP